MGLFSKLFGGGKQTSYSQDKTINRAYDFIGDNYAGVGGETFKRTQNELGNVLGGGFGRYSDQIGLDFLLGEGQDKIGGGAAGRGVFNSGATGKALTEYGTNLKKTYLNDYIDRLFANANQGMEAGKMYADAGTYSESASRGMSSNTPGVAGFLGSIMAKGAKG